MQEHFYESGSCVQKTHASLQELEAQAPITLHDAALEMARNQAEDIEGGRIDPYARACRIWLSYSFEVPELERWSNMVINYEGEAETGRVDKAKLQILQAALNLLSAAK